MYQYKGKNFVVRSDEFFAPVSELHSEADEESKGCEEYIGSHAGYLRHLRRKEKACSECLKGHREHVARYQKERVGPDCGTDKGIDWHRRQKSKLCWKCQGHKEGMKVA